MTSFKSFEDIEVWKKSRVLADTIYKEVTNYSFDSDRSLRHQMLRSSGSIMDNIAEGHGRGGDQEFKQFLWIAKGSASELRSQIYRAYDRNFINESTFQVIMDKASEVEKMIKGLINHIRSSEYKGSKYIK